MEASKSSSFLIANILLIGIVWASENTTCPNWYYDDNSTKQCQCGYGLECQTNGVLIEDGTCATLSGDGYQYYLGNCSLDHPINRTNRQYSMMPNDPDLLDQFMCGPFNRKGLLCEECISGYGPSFYTLDMTCVDCSKLSTGYSISIYVLLELLPITTVYIFIAVFRFNVSAGPLFGYAYFCQYITSWLNQKYYIYDYILSHNKFWFQASVTMSQFWNLQFFYSTIPPFCISDKLTYIDVQMLHLVRGVFPVILAIATCILIKLHDMNYRIILVLWKPFGIMYKKINRVTRSDSVIHAFASLILLSYGNTTSTMAAIQQNYDIHNQYGTLYKVGQLFDPNMVYLGHKHLLYSLIAGLPFVLLVVLPLILLTIYPTRIYSRCISRCLSARKRLAITAFCEALNQCFKDGLNGTRDYRSLAGLPVIIIPLDLCFRKLLIQYYGGPITFAAHISMYFVCCFVLTFIHPAKSTAGNFSLGFMFLVLGLMRILEEMWELHDEISTHSLVNSFILVSLLPHIMVFVWIGYKLHRPVMKCLTYYRHTLFNHQQLTTVICDCMFKCKSLIKPSYQMLP